MDVVTDPALHHLPVTLRNLQSTAFQPPHPALASQLDPEFDSSGYQPYTGIDDIQRSTISGQHLSPNNNLFAQPQSQPRARLHGQRVNGQHDGHQHTPILRPGQSPSSVYHPDSGSRYSVLASEDHFSSQQPLNLYTPVRALQQQEVNDLNTLNQNGGSNKDDGGGHFSGMKLIQDPPDLEQWRERLFNVEDTILLTEEEFQTYFPHIDNVYSHRSTQRYKRKPFLSHYWDCRLKGRPPGTPKSCDPNKKKRRRTARERDLCDVKIKITEYFPGAAVAMAQPDFGAGVDPVGNDTGAAINFIMENGGSAQNENESTQPFGVLAPSSNLPAGHPGATGAKYYTIQRVSGNVGDDKSHNFAASHKHTLEESDRVKKNSVQRWSLKEEKEKKRLQVCLLFFQCVTCAYTLALQYLRSKTKLCVFIPASLVHSLVIHLVSKPSQSLAVQ